MHLREDFPSVWLETLLGLKRILCLPLPGDNSEHPPAPGAGCGVLPCAAPDASVKRDSDPETGRGAPGQSFKGAQILGGHLFSPNLSVEQTCPRVTQHSRGTLAAGPFSLIPEDFPVGLKTSQLRT